MIDVEDEKIKEAIKKSIANISLEDDYCLQIDNNTIDNAIGKEKKLIKEIKKNDK